MEKGQINENRENRSRKIAKAIIAISGIIVISSMLIKKIEPDIPAFLDNTERTVNCSLTFLRAGTTRIENTLNSEFDEKTWKIELKNALGLLYNGPFFVCPNSKY